MRYYCHVTFEASYICLWAVPEVLPVCAGTKLLLPSPFRALWSEHITELDISGGLQDFSLIAPLSNLQF